MVVVFIFFQQWSCRQPTAGWRGRRLCPPLARASNGEDEERRLNSTMVRAVAASSTTMGLRLRGRGGGTMGTCRALILIHIIQRGKGNNHIIQNVLLAAPFPVKWFDGLVRTVGQCQPCPSLSYSCRSTVPAWSRPYCNPLLAMQPYIYLTSARQSVTIFPFSSIRLPANLCKKSGKLQKELCMMCGANSELVMELYGSIQPYCIVCLRFEGVFVL